MRLYLDSSALVKLVQSEAESEALRAFLRERSGEGRVTSTLAHVEVLRAVAGGGSEATARARRELARVDQIVLGPDVLESAATLLPDELIRSLDAIHLASARAVGSELRTIVTYDRRMADAATRLGLDVAAPD